MKRYQLCIPLTLLIFCAATRSVCQQRKAPTTGPQGEVSARAADIPPPAPLALSKIKNPHVNYVLDWQVKNYPLPSVIFRREGLALPVDRREIIEKIIYPAINKSNQPIAAVVIEFFPDKPEVGVTLIWHAVGSLGSSQDSSALISRNNFGHFSGDSYLRLFHEENQ